MSIEESGINTFGFPVYKTLLYKEASRYLHIRFDPSWENSCMHLYIKVLELKL